MVHICAVDAFFSMTRCGELAVLYIGARRGIGCGSCMQLVCYRSKERRSEL